jgi:hypothetical protein
VTKHLQTLAAVCAAALLHCGPRAIGDRPRKADDRRVGEGDIIYIARGIDRRGASEKGGERERERERD